MSLLLFLLCALQVTHARQRKLRPFEWTSFGLLSMIYERAQRVAFSFCFSSLAHYCSSGIRKNTFFANKQHSFSKSIKNHFLAIDHSCDAKLNVSQERCWSVSHLRAAKKPYFTLTPHLHLCTDHSHTHNTKRARRRTKDKRMRTRPLRIACTHRCGNMTRICHTLAHVHVNTQ